MKRQSRHSELKGTIRWGEKDAHKYRIHTCDSNLVTTEGTARVA